MFIDNINKLRGVVSQNSKSLIGTEFYVTFHDNKKRNEFEGVNGAIKYPACYVFYFKGTLSNKLTWFYEKYNLLTVRSYKLIPIKECIDENSERQSK